jgi:hypothetical protein
VGLPANVSRDYYNLSANRMSLIFQQGKSVLDAELNQIQQILRDQTKLLTLHAIGNGFLGDAFLTMSTTTPNQIKINKGFFFWNGTCVYLPSDIYISTLSTPLSNRTDTVWVEFLDLDNDSTEDTALFDAVLGKETVHSLKRQINVYVSEGTVPTPLAGNTNWFIISKLNRLAGDSQIHDATILDKRVETANTFVDEGLRVTQGATPTEYTWTEGRSTVANFDYFHPVPSTSLPPVYANYSFDLAPTTGLPQDLTIVAKVSGNAGNFISIAFIHPGVSNYLTPTISVTGTAIVVTYSTDTFSSITSTLYQIEQLINNDPQASALVQASLVPGVDVNAITAQTYLTTFLQNGQDGIPGIRYAPINNSVYVYVDVNGDVVNSAVRPPDFHAVLAKITSGSSGIVTIDDMRMFRPAANRGGLANRNYSEGGQIPSEGGSVEKDFLVEEFINAYSVVTYGTTPDSIRNASGLDETRVPTFAISVTDLLPGQRAIVQLKGEVTNTNWSWIAEQPLYLDTISGQITQTDHNTAGTVSQYLGYALTTTSIWFDPDQTYIKN